MRQPCGLAAKEANAMSLQAAGSHTCNYYPAEGPACLFPPLQSLLWLWEPLSYTCEKGRSLKGALGSIHKPRPTHRVLREGRPASLLGQGSRLRAGGASQGGRVGGSRGAGKAASSGSSFPPQPPFPPPKATEAPAAGRAGAGAGLRAAGRLPGGPRSAAGRGRRARRSGAFLPVWQD